MLEWLHENATAIQAASAIIQAGGAMAVAALTLVLIRVTQHYTRTTDGYAETAERQLRESILAREASLRPYLHVKFIHLTSDDDRHFLNVSLVNSGLGPAFSVEAQVRVGEWGRDDNRETVAETNGPTQLNLMEAGCDDHWLILETNPAFPVPPFGICEGVCLFVAYRDLLDHWWITEVPISINSKLEDGSLVAELSMLDSLEVVHRNTNPDMIGFSDP